MTSSDKAAARAAADDLPPTLQSMWRLCRLGYRHEPRLMVWAFALSLLAAFAIPTVLTSTWRPAVERAAQEKGAQPYRLARHLFTVATTAPAGKEVRVAGIGERLVAQRREAWERGYAPIASARWESAV